MDCHEGMHVHADLLHTGVLQAAVIILCSRFCEMVRHFFSVCECDSGHSRVHKVSPDASDSRLCCSFSTWWESVVLAPSGRAYAPAGMILEERGCTVLLLVVLLGFSARGGTSGQASPWRCVVTPQLELAMAALCAEVLSVHWLDSLSQCCIIAMVSSGQPCVVDTSLQSITECHTPLFASF